MVKKICQKLFLGSVNINSDGIAQLVFKSTGRGDITVIAESEGLTSNEVILHDYLYAPPFTSEHPTPTTKLDSGYQVSQTNGELTLIGGCISDGWGNEGLWEYDYDYIEDF